MNKWNRLLESLDVMYGFQDKLKSTFRKTQHTFDERTNEYVVTIEYRVRRGNDSAKVTKGNKLKFSPHQIAYHVAHPHNSFILAEHLGSGSLKLYEGAVVRELVACGLELEACSLGLEACCLRLETLGERK